MLPELALLWLSVKLWLEKGTEFLFPWFCLAFGSPFSYSQEKPEKAGWEAGSREPEP
jgi:hypothetical protein